MMPASTVFLHKRAVKLHVTDVPEERLAYTIILTAVIEGIGLKLRAELL